MEALAPERRLAGRYVLQEPIASGAMASVWLAFDEVLARPVAVKVLRDDLADDPTFAQRFQIEAVAAGRLTHPNIVQVFDTGVEHGVHYIVLEHFAGRPLRQVMASEPQMDPQRAIDLIRPVLAALAFAHAEGVLHRDVTPGNILIGEGRVKVTDFGIAKAAFAETDLTRTGSVLGTVGYLSPEQVSGGDIDGRSDLYSVGVVLYEMLTGRPPFVGETDVATAMMRLQTTPTPLRAIRPAIPRPLEAIVLRAMAPNPGERFTSAESMGAVLDRLRSAGEPTPPYAVRPVARRAGGPAERERARQAAPWLAIGVLVALVAAVVGVIAAFTNGFGAGSNGSNATRQSAAASGQHTSSTRTIHISDARDWDPEGSDHSEHPETTHLAIDGDPSTAWTTDHYDTASFGNLKDGVGLWLGLGSATRIASVTVRSPIDGWTFQLRPGPYGDPGAAAKSSNGATSFTIRGHSITVHLGSLSASGLLVWITSLGPDGGRFAAAVSDVTVEGS